MTIGIYGEHAFLITDINKVTNNYTCGDCGSRFTLVGNLARHAKTCSRGETKFDCPGNRILAPESAFERPFIPKAVSVSRQFAGLSTRQSSETSTFTTKDVATGVSESFLAAKSMVITQKAKPSSSTTAAICTAAPSASQAPKKGPTYSQKTAMGAKSHERTPTNIRRKSAIFFGATATQ